MSLLPALLNELAGCRGYRRPAAPVDLFDQNFGLGLAPDDLWQFANASMPSFYLRPWRNNLIQQSGVSTINNNKDEFKVNLDVQQFKPEEVSVKVVDNAIVVEGKHEEREDEHGYIRREFTRKYMLPEDINAEQISSSLSSDGVLTISAPKQALTASGNERSIPITQTQKPAIQQSGSQGNQQVKTD